MVNPGSVRVSGCAGLSVITKVEPGCISAVTRCAISGARVILFRDSDAIRGDAASILVPDGKPIASHLRCRGSESSPVNVKAWVPNGFSGERTPTGAEKLSLPLTNAMTLRSAVEITNDEA